MAYPSTVPVTAGVGTGIAFDVVGAVSFQAVKLDIGATGVASGPVSDVLGLPMAFAVPGQGASRLSWAKIDCAASGENVLVAGVTAKTVRLHKLFIVFDSPVNIFFKDAAGGNALTGTMVNVQTLTLDFDAEPWMETAVAGALILNLSAAIGARGRLGYKQS